MPQLPTINARSSPGVLSLPGVSPQSFGAQAGQGLSEFGQALQQVAAKVQAQQDETDLIAKVSDYKVYLATLPDAIINDPNIKPEDRVAHYKAKADEFRETALNEGANASVRLALRNHSNRMVAEGIIHMQTADIHERVERTRINLLEEHDRLAVNEAAQEARGDYYGATATRQERQESLRRAEDRKIFSPAEARNADRAAIDRKWSVVAQQNPAMILQIYRDVQQGIPVPSGMDPTKIDEYARLASMAEAGQRAEAARLAKQQKEALEAAQEVTRQTFIQKLTAGKLTTNEILESNLDASGDGSKEHYISLLAAHAREKRESFVSDPRLFADTLQKIRTRDIRSETEIEQIYIDSANRGRGITDEDMVKLRKEFDEQRTPQGRTLTDAKQKLFDKYKSSIDKSIFGQREDAEGKRLMGEYTQWVTDRVDEYRRQGKDPHVLFDEQSTEYVGNQVSRYQRSFDDEIKAKVEQFKRPNRAALPKVEPRKDGETPEAYLKRTEK